MATLVPVVVVGIKISVIPFEEPTANWYELMYVGLNTSFQSI